MLERELSVSKSEKAVALATSLGVGISYGASAGVGTYSFITASSVGGGLGVGVAAASAPFWVAGACALSAVVALAFCIYEYKEYIHAANKLIEKINKAEQKRKQAAKEYLDDLCKQALLAIRLHYLYAAAGFASVQGGIDKNNQTVNIAPLLSLINSRPALVAALKSGRVTDEVENKLRKFIMPELEKTSHLKEASKHKTIQPSMNKAIFGGVVATVVAVSTLLASTAGTAALFLGAGVVFAALGATPIVGWSILAGVLMVGIVVGCAYGYYKYKNSQREAVIANKRAETKSLVAAKDTLSEQNKKMKKQLMSEQHELQLANEKAAQLTIDTLTREAASAKTPTPTLAMPSSRGTHHNDSHFFHLPSGAPSTSSTRPSLNASLNTETKLNNR